MKTVIFATGNAGKMREIREILSGTDDPEACAAALTETARKNGGRDNITVIVIRI